MITIEQIKDEQEELLKKMRHSDRRKVRSIQKRLLFLKMCSSYLEKKRDEKYLQKELDEFSKIIDANDKQFNSWTAKLKRQYDNFLGMDILKQQIRILKYLLS